MVSFFFEKMTPNYENKLILFYLNFIHLTKFGLYYNYVLVLGVKEESINCCFGRWRSM